MPAGKHIDLSTSFFYPAVVRLKLSALSVLFPLLILGILFVTGCATGVKHVPPDYPAVVMKEGNLFLSFNLSKDNALVNEYLAEKNILKDYEDLLQRTGRLSFTINGSGNSISGVAQGNFPRFWSAFFLGFDSEWSKKKSTPYVWRHKVSGTEISIIKSGVVFFSQGSPVEPLLEKAERGDYASLPVRVKKAMDSFPVVVYSYRPSADLFKSFGMNTKVMYVEDLLLSLDSVTVTNKANIATGADSERKGYLVSGTINFRDEKGAKIFNTGLKLALLTMAIKDSNSSIRDLIKANPFSLNGRSIIIKNVQLDMKDIISLMGDKGR